MKIYLARALPFIILIILAVLPYLASAQIKPGESWYLVPECARSSKGTDACTFASLIELLGKLLQFAVYLVIPLATVGILITGIRLTLYGEAEKKAARQSMQNLLIGIFFTLAAYVIIDTILKWLARPEVIQIPGQ